MFAEAGLRSRGRGSGTKEDKAGAVDIFSLDVEGAEGLVLKHMDWSVQVGVWVIELDAGDKARDAAVRRQLLERGYLPARSRHSCAYNIRHGCRGECTVNEVFVHPDLCAVKDRAGLWADMEAMLRPNFVFPGSVDDDWIS